jgi:hypothetical protein
MGGAAAPIGAPGREDVEAVPVVLPAELGLVDAAAEGQPVALGVFEDTGLLVEETKARDGLAALVAGHGHLHVQVPLGDHPGQQSQGVHRSGVIRAEQLLQQRRLHPVAQIGALLDGGDVLRLQGASHHQAHPAPVADETLDSAGGQG